MAASELQDRQFRAALELGDRPSTATEDHKVKILEAALANAQEDLAQAREEIQNLKTAFELQLQEKELRLQKKDEIIVEQNITINDLLQAREESDFGAASPFNNDTELQDFPNEGLEVLYNITAFQSTGTNQPVPDSTFNFMRQGFPAKDRPKRLDQLSKPIRLPCAVMINKDGGIMGNPFGSMPGWAVKVDLDAGAHGQPSIGLDFELSRAGVRPKKAKDQNTFAVGWEPGVAIGGQWMMEDLHMFKATNPPDPRRLEDTFPPAIRGLLTEAKGNQIMLASNLICATFISNVHKSSPMKIDWALALKSDESRIPYANLQSMYQSEGKSYQVTLWFVNRKVTLARFHTDCLDPLVDAVTDHTPPFHEYLDENNEPMPDFNLEEIHPVGNGIYRRYPKVLDRTDKRVENRFGKLTSFNLRKIVTWESIKALHTRASIGEEERVSIPYAQRGPRSPHEPHERRQNPLLTLR